MWLSPDSEWGQRTKPDYLKMSPRSRTLSRCWFPPSGPCMRMFTPMRVSPSLLIFVFHLSRRHWTRHREPLEPDGSCLIPRQKWAAPFQNTAALQGPDAASVCGKILEIFTPRQNWLPRGESFFIWGHTRPWEDAFCRWQMALTSAPPLRHVQNGTTVLGCEWDHFSWSRDKVYRRPTAGDFLREASFYHSLLEPTLCVWSFPSMGWSSCWAGDHWNHSLGV